MKKRNKRKKFSIKKTLKLIIPIIVLTIVIINSNNILITYLSKKTGYQKETISIFLETDNYKIIKNNEYSKTLDEIVNTDNYNPKYLNKYLNIKYIKNDNFFKNINCLLSLGYKENDINLINEKLTQESIDILINNEYIKDITTFIDISHFKEDILKRYIDYYKKEEKEIETTITYVNIGLDNEYYTNVLTIENPDDISVLVNKYNTLKKEYVPKDLETINSKYGSGKLRKEAKIAFEEMCQAAKKENITIYGGSGYRSYDYQKNLYNKYVKQDGKTQADTYSARAGYSEHQTGLAMDILNGKWEYVKNNHKEYTWLINNSYKYGYILRYPKGKENITGYMYEEWHYRYVGKDIAKEIYNLNITYDEYIAKK